MATKIITKETILRLVSDIKSIKKNPLHSHGIYYQHDENDMLLGRALIIGPPETPYFGGNFFFRLHFPDDYPYKPPLLNFCTNGDSIRMHPNLYTNGKVCLSVLNTWHGEQWTSCQTISSILLALQTILCKDPFLNEPGITKSHREFKIYNEIIEFKNIEIAVLNILNKLKPYYIEEFGCFQDNVIDNFVNNKDSLKQFMLSKSQEVKFICHSFYSMRCFIDYPKLLLSFPDNITMETKA